MADKTHTLSVAEMPSSTHIVQGVNSFPPGTRLMFYGAKEAPPGWRIVEHGAGSLLCEKE